MHVGARKVCGADDGSLVLVLAGVRLGHLSETEVRRQLHSKLLAHQASVENVVGILVRLKNRRKKVLTLVKVLSYAPLLEAEHVDA